MMKKILKGILPAVLLITLATPGFAENRSGTFNLSPFVGGYLLDHAQLFENRPIFGLRAGYNFTKNLGAEAMFGYSLTETKQKFGSPRETDLYRYGVDILYHFMPDNDFVPFIEVGGGVTNFHIPNTPSIKEPFYIGQVNYGVGFKYFVADNVALRADVRHAVLVSDPADNNLEYSVGLTFQFGGKAKPAPALVAKCEPCPKAEIPPPVAIPIVEEPLLEPVPAAEPTPERMKYCVSLNIEFDINKADIRPQYNDEVAKVGDFMKKYPTTTAVIEGYADEVGSDAYNIQLSQRRAESVVKSLVDKFGIEPARLSAKGYGKTRPIADNATDAGKQKNRRINAIIDCALDVKELATPPERLCMTLKVEFATDSAEINSRYYDEVNKVGEYMKKYPTTTAIIEGHTDNIGNSEHNMKLSQQRAENVVNYLVEKFGIERSRLSAKGYGFSRRIAYNNTTEGRQKNRRINAVIDCVIKK
jgi:OmpA-OmpF porin, OOP family